MGQENWYAAAAHQLAPFLMAISIRACNTENGVRRIKERRKPWLQALNDVGGTNKAR